MSNFAKFLLNEDEIEYPDDIITRALHLTLHPYFIKF